MTIHAFTDYECKFCHLAFIPLPTARICPKCGRKSHKVFHDFRERTLQSASFNLAKDNSFIPGAWGMFTIGDRYYWLAFQFLQFTSSYTNVKDKDLLNKTFSEKKAHELAAKFVDKLNFGKEKYRAAHMEAFFSSLLLPSIKIGARKNAVLRYSCFLCHSKRDKEFVDKLYSDLLASSISCWYFPEDAVFGKGVWSEIDGKIQSSEKVIVVCSSNSLQSSPVIREIERVLQREDVEKKDILIPIAIDNYIFQNWQHSRKADVVGKVVGSFHNWKRVKQYQKSFRRLLQSVQ